MNLDPNFLLPAAGRRKLPSRSEELSLEGLRELMDDEYLGLAARTAIECVERRRADPRLMLLLLEKAQEGYFEPASRAESDRQRYAQRRGNGQ